ncbi:MAG: DUF6714 family protein [Planctomycetota bacterium]
MNIQDFKLDLLVNFPINRKNLICKNDEYEVKRFYDSIENNQWSDVDFPKISENYSVLPLLSIAEWRYFIPAFMLQGLIKAFDSNARDLTICEFTCYSVIGTKYDELVSCKSVINRIESLNNGQKLCVYKFLNFAKEAESTPLAEFINSRIAEWVSMASLDTL